MDRLQSSKIYLARLTLEAKTALSISTGNDDGVFDTALVRDANGLPAIPGTSLTGVLRHLWIDTFGAGNANSANRIFGFQSGDSGSASRVSISWGCLLDSTGKATEGLFNAEKEGGVEDELYRAVLNQADTPVLRDRVRLTHRGAATDQGKYNRSVVPAGHRFAVEIRFWSDDHSEDENNWKQLLQLFEHPALRLGGATRAGLGRMCLVSCYDRCFDLKSSSDVEQFQSLSRDINDVKALKNVNPDTPKTEHFVSGTLTLNATGPWRFGQGNESISPKVKNPADLLPKTEERIYWPASMDSGETAERKMQLLLFPASSLKGALAHRMSFHARCFKDDWNFKDVANVDARPPEIDRLLGSMNDNQSGEAGLMYIDDVTTQVEAEHVIHLMHTAIDRFTGGVRDGMLFEEECIFGGSFSIRITLKLDPRINKELATIRYALKGAIDDLCNGRLGLGSKTTAGNGFFAGSLTGELADWLKSESQENAA